LALVLIAPAVVGLALLVVFLGRGVDARAQAQSAAEAAAQAAALERSPSAAVAAAQRIGSEMLVDVDSCAEPIVQVDTSDFRPGGSIGVAIECIVSRRALEPVHPGTSVQSARAIAHIDEFRAAEGSQ
jgi:hypothetical protein